MSELGTCPGPSAEELSTGIRDAVFIIDADDLKGPPAARIRIDYLRPGSTRSPGQPSSMWVAISPLTAAQPALCRPTGWTHSPQAAASGPASPIRKVGNETFASGIGAFANSILEYPINRQFETFTAKVGVDAATEGKGSVIFEVWVDGEKKWPAKPDPAAGTPPSPTMTGLDPVRAISVDVRGANRLRLVLNDAGDEDDLTLERLVRTGADAG